MQPESVGKPWGSRRGIVQFRGNPTHTYYGEGPLPANPKVLWRFPRHKKMCAISWVGKKSKNWCGSGWTGQPVVWEKEDGEVEVIFGAYDRRVHFLNGATGRRVRKDFPTRDIIKGSVSLDPDGYPLLYFGSRDNRFRIVALDRKKPKLLWSLPARVVKGIHNNDWDANASIVGDRLFIGGENGYFFIIKLNRRYGPRGKVRVNPVIEIAHKGWLREHIKVLGDTNASIENSAAVFGDRVYFANGHGRLLGLDISATDGLRMAPAPVAFEFWVGDDVDASIVVDSQGALFVAAESERDSARAKEVGQLFKLDPSRPEKPLVWKHDIPAAPNDRYGGGIWSTPALADGILYATSQSGRVLAVDAQSGKILWEKYEGRHLWSSPVVVDGHLLLATCGGELVAFALKGKEEAQERWRIKVGEGKCIESTPAVYDGKIFVGTWDGHFYAIGESGLPVAKGTGSGHGSRAAR